MAAPMGVSLALAVIFCLLAGISGQGFAAPNDDIRKFTLYIEGLDFEQNQQIANDSSKIYSDAKSEIQRLLQSYGGYIDQVNFRNGYSCVAADVYWVGVEEGDFRNALDRMDSLQTAVSLSEVSHSVSLKGCTGESHLLAFSLYLSGISWSDEMRNHTNSVYMIIKQQVQTNFAELGGQIRTLELADNNGCIHIFVEWETFMHEEIIGLTNRLKDSGMVLNNQPVTVSLRPCAPTDADVDECPPVPAGTSGICVFGCSEDNPCDEGFKCCRNGCGQVCTRVGYKVRVTASVMVDGMVRFSSSGSLFEDYVGAWVISQFDQLTSSRVVHAEVTKTYTKRTTIGRDYTALHVNIYLSEDLPNEKLSDTLHMMEGTNLPPGLKWMRIAEADFVNYSLDDITSCGGVECHGICKHQITGEDYCSCGSGRMGPSCWGFDCHADPSSASQGNLCENGQCMTEEDEGNYCECNEGSYGDLCDVSVCDMLHDPCGEHGKCLGYVNTGVLCQCDQGWSGLFCDENNSLDATLSTCEKERRLMQFVHRQVYSDALAPQLNVFMSTLLKRMGAVHYSIPNCWAADSGKAGEYHSTCQYYSNGGAFAMCECLNTLGEPSGYHYFGEDDCRVFSGSDDHMQYDYFYILNTTWSEDFLFDDSIKEQISDEAKNIAGAGVTHVDIRREGNDCIGVLAVWYSSDQNDEGKLVSNLVSSGITINGRERKISRSDCSGQDMGGDHVIMLTFYVSELPSPRDVSDTSGTVYSLAKEAVNNAISVVGGSLRTLKLSESEEDCVMFYVEFEADHSVNSYDVLEKLKANGLPTSSKFYPVSLRPCEPKSTDDHRCPALPPGTVGTCVEMCGADNPCPDGQICCSNGCGHTCRTPPTYEHMATFTFYVSGIPRPRDVKDQNGMAYRSAKDAVRTAFSQLGGRLRTLVLSESAHGCVMFFVEWESADSLNTLEFWDKLKANGLRLFGTDLTVRLRPCLPTDDTNDGCPALPPNTFGTCDEACGDENPCDEGFKCCSNGCGRRCVRVNYKVKVHATITVDMKITDDLWNINSALRMTVKDSINMMIQEVFNLGQTSIVVGVDLRGISKWEYQNKTYPVLNVDMFLSADVPNNRLRQSANLLERNMLPGVQGQPDILSVEFATHSMHDVYGCGNVKCNGICKTDFSEGDFCSCWPGQRGQGCDSFDCRHYLTHFSPFQSFCDRGQCELQESSSSFGCDCPPGYYGDRCDVTVCDMTVDVCSNRGVCEGRVEEGMLCQCDGGRGGIFCEKETTEDEQMTTCEKERRMMLFVLEQVKGQGERSPRLATFMSSILHRMQAPVFPVPFCHPADPGSAPDRQYQSVCYYDSNSGDKVHCECVGTDKEPNGYAYYAEGDCRDESGIINNYESFFVTVPEGVSRDALTDAVIAQVSRKLQSLGGRLGEMTTDEAREGCMVIQVMWLASSQTRATLVDLLLDADIMVSGQMIETSRELCKGDEDINSCPVMLPNHMELIVDCGSPCTSDDDCGDDSKCCNSGCATMTCTEVGFKDKVNVSVTVDMEWNPMLEDSKNFVYLAVKTQIENGLDEEMRGRGIRGYQSAKIVKFFPVKVPNESSRRRKRQAEEILLLGILIELRFNSSVPVDSLQTIQSDLQREGLSVDGTVYKLQRVRFGKVEEDLEPGQDFLCGSQICERGSFCVERVGGIEYCACPKGKRGPSCAIIDCHIDDGDTLCENGGTCKKFGDEIEGSECMCSDGYFGQFCEAEVCNYLADDACGSGKCVGDMEAPDFCRCPEGTGGLFCELDETDPFMTPCQKSRRMTQYIVKVWQGLEQSARIKDIDDFMEVLVPLGQLAMPHCYEEDSMRSGAFHSRCLYNMETKKVERCICVDEEGMPNHWDYDYETGQCRVYNKECDGLVCHNGGSCVVRPGSMGYCDCPDGFGGLHCEEKRESMCPEGRKPLMTNDEPLQCRMGPCPYGFMCNAHPADQWTACCFDEGFLCKENPCQAGGSCVGNIMSGQVCKCPAGTGGILCETTVADERLTPCQTMQRFMDAIISILSGNPSPIPGLDIENLRTILVHNEMEWIPQESCDAEGQYKSVTQAAYVLNPRESREICLDSSGVPDPFCRAATCQMLSMNGQMQVCENGGRCVGDVRQQLCDCWGTGHHGFRCQIRGRGRNETECTLGRDIAMYAIGVLHDDTQPDMLREQMNKIISLHGDEDAGVFVPSCDARGKFLDSGCVHPRVPGKMPTCYCATPDGQMVGEVIQLVTPPEGCDGDKPHGNGTTEHCPKEFGKECIKPSWWCSNTVKCKPHERCAPLTTPEGKTFDCVPKETILPCDYRPCNDNPFAQCSPCGRHGKCYNTIQHGMAMNMTGMSMSATGMTLSGPGKGNENSQGSLSVAGASSGMQNHGSQSGSMHRPSMPDGTRATAAVMTCKCSPGYTGKNCEVNNEVCAALPGYVCEHGCLGDVDRGYLCKCPEGMAGIFCNKPVRTECERRKALYDDAYDIMTDHSVVMMGMNNTQLKTLIGLLVTLEGSGFLPRLNCTPAGLYDKIQCRYDLNSRSEYCHCANREGDYVSSNVEAYIGFDVCTANGDLRGLREYYCSGQNPDGNRLCFNGGTCMFEPYKGHACVCPDGYTGTFCEIEGDSDEQPRSLCEFMNNAFDSMHILRQRVAAGETPLAQVVAILNITGGFIFPYKEYEYFVRPECTEEGAFASSHVCYYSADTKEKDDCFCWGANGPDFFRPLEEDDDADAKCSTAMHCRDMIKEECPELKCIGGYRTDIHGCPVCDCKHPCEDLHCKWGERCQIDPRACHRNRDMTHMPGDNTMDKDDMGKGCAMCVPIHKPGVCTDHNMMTYSSILGGGLTAAMNMEDHHNDDKDNEDDHAEMENMNTCSVSCRDDADCTGKKKCCGVCGSKCVDPVETFTCAEESEKMNKYVQFLKQVEQALMQSQAQVTPLAREVLAKLDRVSSVPYVWLPECEPDGHLFKPLQCEYRVEDLDDGESPKPYQCFCVDRLGMRIRGTEKVDPSDPNACVNKPGECPYLTYVEEDSDSPNPTCSSDVDCLGTNKCCSNGVGMVCAPPAKKRMMALTDRLMSALCKIEDGMCEGICSGDWEKVGTSCTCRTSGRYGPFCQQVITEDSPLRNTPCRRKHVARMLFEANFANYETDPENPQGIMLLFQQYIEQMYATVEGYDWEDEKITMVKYECTADGGYKPMQCVRDVMTWTDIACYCVDADGIELIGTRMDAKEGKPHCGGEDQRMCPLGYPLHDSSGKMLKCGENIDGCPNGYACTRGAYGSQHCCQTREGARDVCSLPVDVGMTCSSTGRQQGPSTLYHFDGSQCVQFRFTGCGGNKNRFRTAADCEKRCKQKVHEGTCPSGAFQVNVRAADGAECKNHCSEDKDCEMTHKCCQSSCGRRCFPAIATSVDRGMCPYGQPQMSCNPAKPCPAGHYCKRESVEGGICCTDHNNVNMCDFAPENTPTCSERIPRYFYNATTMTCEKFTYAGCHPEFNNFKTLKECCGACNGEGRCKPGKCPAVRPGAAISCQSECSADSMCPGREICCSNGCAKICVLPQVELPSDCWERRTAALQRQSVTMSSRSNQCNAVDIPECDASGYWSRQQCHKAYGLCWCVTPMGNFVPDTMTHGPASCDSLTDFDIASADQMKVDPSTAQLDVCPSGENLHCCPRSLCERSCRAFPAAECRINPCGGCNVEYSVDGQQVDCSQGLSTCEQELKMAATAIQERQISQRLMRMSEGHQDDMYEDDMMDNDQSNDKGQPAYRPRVIRPGVPLQCQLPPVTGPCKGYSRKWYYNPDMGTCSMFIWGMCQGNQNRFDSPADCFNACNENADPCKNVTCAAGQVCQHQFSHDCHRSKEPCEVTEVCEAVVSPNIATGVFTPRCQSNGDYNFKQCHDRYCWCVDEEGRYVNGLTTETLSLTCTATGRSSSSVIKMETCPDGRMPNITCVKECARQVCPGNPKAVCKVNMCSDHCGVRFVDGDDEEQEVSCGADKCAAFKFEEEGREECSAKLECSGGTVRHCSESVCHSAQNNCSKNPCAVCSVDPCSCQPKFVDALTGEALSDDQCQYITLGICEAKTCDIMSKRVQARLSGEDVDTTGSPLPQCDEEGRFKPKQCVGEECVCVNEFGFPTREPTDGSCEEIDEIVEVKVSLSYAGSLSDLNTPELVQAFKDAILEKLRGLGINPKNVRLGEPTAGSIKIDITLIEDPDQPEGNQQNLALAANALQQASDSGELDVTVGDKSFGLDGDATSVSARTASQVAPNPRTTPMVPGTTSTARPVDTDDDSGLSQTDKIIIGAVCGGVGLLILIIICYCVCCRSRKKETPPDDTYDHIRAGGNREPTYDKPALYNPAFEEDGNYMKVRM